MHIVREHYLNKLISLKDIDVIKVVTGVRRCGKSTLLESYAKWLKGSAKISASKIIQINLDDPKFSSLSNWKDLYEHIVSKVNDSDKHYVFIDEIQNIEGFERAVEGLRLKKNLDIYITGSNSNMLSSEIATKLSGRTIEIQMTPFSFGEYVKLAGNADQEEALRNYLEYGGFPGGYPIYQQNPSSLDDYLRGIFDTVLMRDIAKRKETVDLNILRMIVDYTFNNVGSLTSPNNIANSLTSNGFNVSVNSVMDYISLLEQSYILYSAKRFDIKGKKLLNRLEKYYLVDIGLRRITSSHRQNADIGHSLENIVYFELCRRFDNVWVGKSGDKEVDFVVESAGGHVEYYQVSYLLSEDSIVSREFGVFDSISNNYPKTVLSLDKFDMSQNGINHMNIIDWLTEGEEENETRRSI